MQTSTEPMDASKQFCPNSACSARGKLGAGNISVQSRKRPRYKCHTCGQTFSARRGTALEGLRTAEEVVIKVMILLSYGCPRQAIVHAFGLDERTLADWQKRAGKHCEQVHEALVQNGNGDPSHVQADEIRVKILFTIVSYHDIREQYRVFRHRSVTFSFDLTRYRVRERIAISDHDIMRQIRRATGKN